MKVPADSKCARCGKGAQLGVTAGDGRVVLFCRQCATKLARKFGMTQLLKEIEKNQN